jgi:hypothetical protein
MKHINKFLPSSSLSGVCSLILFPLFATGVNDTGGKFATGVVDTGGAPWLANISENFWKNSKWSYCCYQGLGGRWFMKKTWSKKSRDTVPLSHSNNIHQRGQEGRKRMAKLENTRNESGQEEMEVFNEDTKRGGGIKGWESGSGFGGWGKLKWVKRMRKWRYR